MPLHFYYCIEGKKGFDFVFGYFFEMTFVVEENEAPYPLHVIFSQCCKRNVWFVLRHELSLKVYEVW